MAYQPLPGDILMCYAPSVVGSAIDTVEGLGLLREHKKPPDHVPIYSHCCVYLGPDPTEDTGLCYVSEALGRGVVRSNAAKYEDVADVWAMSLTAQQREDVVHRANAFWRTHWRYSYGDIFVQFVRLLTGLKMPFEMKRSIICSLQCYDCYQAASEKIAALRNCAPEDIPIYGALEYRGQFGGGR